MKEKLGPQPESPKQHAPEPGAGPIGLPPPPDQSQPSSERRGDYSAMLSSIRADQDRETFVADIRQYAEPLFSLAHELKVSIRSNPTSEELRDKAALGVYLEVALKQFVLDINPFSSNPADYPHEDSDELLTEAERREMVAFWATRRVALKWLDNHPGSEAANEVAGWNIYGFHDQHQRFLKEMWPEIRGSTDPSEKKK